MARALHAGTPVTESVDAVLGAHAAGPGRATCCWRSAPPSAVVLPLTAEARTVGVLTLYQDAGRVVTDEDMRDRAAGRRRGGPGDRAGAPAEPAGAAGRGAAAQPADRSAGDRRTAVVVRYVPAAEAARVGGDWYDAFLQRDGSPVVVIGDVVGHDTAAAAAMGQLRGLLRGIAHFSGAGPAEVLRGLDEAIVHMHTETLATAAVARSGAHDGDAGGWTRLRWANAGHPPPIVLAPDGTVTVLGERGRRPDAGCRSHGPAGRSRWSR